MVSIIYLNGQYVPEQEAKVPFLDRGFQFADGVYDVVAIHKGRPVLLNDHLNRLQRSLGIIQLSLKVDHEEWTTKIKNVMELNSLKPGDIEEGYIYLQVTRGPSVRTRIFPSEMEPTIAILAKSYEFPIRYDPTTQTYHGNIHGVSAITTHDERWKRSDLKSLALLPSVLAAQKAHEAGAFEALLVGDDGFINEGTVSNVWMVDQHGTLITPPESHRILPGIVRRKLIQFVKELEIPFEERHFTEKEAYEANELFLSGTRTKILPITKLNGQSINNSSVGDITRQLLRKYWEQVYSGAWFG